MDLTGNINYSEGANLDLISTQTSSKKTTTNSIVSPCPDNIDFENGNFNNWKCFTGHVDSSGNTNVITVSPSAPTPGRHTIVSRTLPSPIDPYGLFSTNPPDGSNFAVKLGNTRIGAEAERIQYTIRVPANDSNFSIKYDYAVIFQDPGHTAWTQPRFTAKIFDSAPNVYIDCASFEYISTSSLPGFAPSTVDTSVIYKPWATAFISLRGHQGRTLYLQFTTADCVRRGHWGYAYVDVESTCGHSIDMNYECTTGIATLDGPPGFQTYNWWNHDYSTLLATGQQATLNPAPQVNSTVWLEMIPFNDFGCRDSMPVQITGTFTPHFDVSEQNAICAPHRFTFYNRNIPAASAIWNFGDGSNGVGDTVTHIFTLPGTYIVTMNVTLPGGCNAVCLDTINITQPVGSLNYTAGNFCNSTSVNFNATSSNIDSINWNFGDGTTLQTNQNNITHIYSAPGAYVPYVTLISNSGCVINIPGTDTIKIEKLLSEFNIIQQRNCGNTVITFIDSSYSFFGITGYQWNFGDGNTGSGNSISHTWTVAGTYSVQLIITGIMGCRDTITKQIVISINAVPTASIAGPVTACAAVPVIFNGSVQSADAINSMQWIASNGDTGTGNLFTVNFALPGNYTIQLIAGTINGCFDTINHLITINPIPDVIQPANVEFCNGENVASIIFSGSLSGTNFTWINNNPSIGLPANGSGNLPSFIALNSTAIAISGTVSITSILNGCEGITKTFIITVLPIPSVNMPVNQTVCNRGTTLPVLFNSFTTVVNSSTYSWTNNMPVIGLAASGTGDIPSFTAINNTPFPITATITITAANGNCQGIPQAFTITVNPTPDVALPINQTLCNGANSNTIACTGTVSTATYSWTNNNPAIGLGTTGISDIPSFIGLNSGFLPVTATITIASSFNGCPGIPASFTILVNPTPDVNQPGNQTICSGNSTSLIPLSGSVNNTTYNWTNDLPSIGLQSNGTGNIASFTPVNNSGINISATITVTPIANGCTGVPIDFVITILPQVDMIQPMNQFQCNGEATPAMSFTGTVAGTTYSWVNNLPSIGLPSNGMGSIPSFTTINTTNAPVTAAITVTASANNCPGSSKTFYITVDPTPDITQPVNQTLCNGSMVSPVTFVGTVSGTSFNWINSASAIGLPAYGAGNISAFTATNNTHFPVTAIIQVTGTANSCGSVVKVFTITVNPSPEVDVPTDKTVCNGSVQAGIPLTGPVSGTSYSW